MVSVTGAGSTGAHLGLDRLPTDCQLMITGFLGPAIPRAEDESAWIDESYKTTEIHSAHVAFEQLRPIRFLINNRLIKISTEQLQRKANELQERIQIVFDRIDDYTSFVSYGYYRHVLGFYLEKNPHKMLVHTGKSHCEGAFILGNAIQPEYAHTFSEHFLGQVLNIIMRNRMYHLVNPGDLDLKFTWAANRIKTLRPGEKDEYAQLLVDIKSSLAAAPAAPAAAEAPSAPAAPGDLVLLK